MNERTKALLTDMLHACTHVQAIVAGRHRNELASDLTLAPAIERKITIIGEALAQAVKAEPALKDTIPDARQIIGMRNILIHNYSAVNPDDLWTAATSSVPALLKHLGAVMAARVLEYDRKGFEEHYAKGFKPWDSGEVDAELLRVLNAGQLSGKTVLEIGCGTGTNAIEFARRGYDVVACDFVAQAIDEARKKASAASVKIDFRVADVLHDDLGGPYDVIFDRGVYHGLRHNLKKFQAAMEKVSRKGTRFFVLAGNAKEQTKEMGPPRVHEHEFRAELGGLFDILEVREFRFGTDKEDFRPLGWAILMERK